VIDAGDLADMVDVIRDLRDRPAGMRIRLRPIGDAGVHGLLVIEAARAGPRARPSAASAPGSAGETNSLMKFT